MTEIENAELNLSLFRRRLIVMALVVLAAFLLILARLIDLQVGRYEEFQSRAERNRTAIVPIVPYRGMILDRNGVVLATNHSDYTVEITPSKTISVDATIETLAQIIEIDARDRRRFYKLLSESRNFNSLPLRTRLTEEEVARIAAQSYRMPGVEIKARLYRVYPQGDVAGHVIGHIGSINEKDKERLQESEEDEANYRGTQVIGKLGIEQSFERELHGTTGVEQIEKTTAGGWASQQLFDHPAQPGNTVMLSIDIKLQKLIEDMFGNRRGALVALNPQNGEILAFVSMPTFDPNLFVDGIDTESWDALNTSLDKPLFNRALRGTYPPGSTYKPFMALAALETGKRKPQDTIVDNGSWTLGDRVFRSHGAALGSVDMRRSIEQSSNVYYYQLAYDMGVDTIHRFMQPLGFGQKTGLDIWGEVTGVLPSTEWKRTAYRRAEQKKWFPGETISLGIGQGYNNFNMLQLAHATATIVNGGLKYTPHLVVAIQDALTRTPTKVIRHAPVNLGYKSEHLALIKEAMVSVTKGGTSTRVFAGANYLSGGKTGTAQAVTLGQKEKYNKEKLAEYQRDHSLYIGFAPAENPTIAVAVIVENAGWGASIATPIVRRVFDYWIDGRYPSEQDLKAMQKGLAIAPLGTPRQASEVLMPVDANAP